MKPRKSGDRENPEDLQQQSLDVKYQDKNFKVLPNHVPVKADFFTFLECQMEVTPIGVRFFFFFISNAVFYTFNPPVLYPPFYIRHDKPFFHILIR